MLCTIEHRKSLVWKLQQTCTGIHMLANSAAQRSINSFAHSQAVSSRSTHCPTKGQAPKTSVGIDQGQTQSVKGSVNKGGVSQCLLTDQVNRFHGIPVMTAI